MPNILDAHKKRVGKQIRKARIGSGLSHDKLAARIGTSRQHLIRLEHGEHLPRPAMLEAIARETDRDVSFFESDEDDEESDPVTVLMTALRRVVREEMSRS